MDIHAPPDPPTVEVIDSLADEEEPNTPEADETAPILAPARTRRSTVHSLDDRFTDGWLSASTKRGIAETAELSAPVILGNLAKSLTNLYVMLRFPSQRVLGTQSLASAVLANFYIQVFGNATAIGGASALETLCSQAFGAGHLSLLGVYLQRGILFYILFLFVPVAALFWFAEPVFLALGQQPDLARGAAQICRGAIWGMIPNGMIECFQHYLLSQGKVWAPVAIFWVGFIVALTVGGPLITGKVEADGGVHVDAYDLTAVGWTISAVCTSYALMAILFSLVFTRKSGAFTGFQPKEALAPKELWHYIKLAVYGYLMLVADLIVFEGLSVLSGLIGERELASQGILLSMTSLIYFTFPVCVAFVAAVRVGRALGANKYRAAKKGYISAIGLGMVGAIAISSTMVGLRFELPLFFSDDAKVIEQVSAVLPLVAVISAIDNSAIISTGVLRGMGKQYFSAITNIGGLVLCGLGSACIMVLVLNYKLWGIWIGLLIGTVIVTGSQVGYLSLVVDWKAEAQAVVDRFKARNEEGNSSGEPVEPAAH
ncbi:mate-domain-containing protein [Hyaloraphidium curvatum]|nr:mate-domain-containing protein [Hyaloraphidium curvatum]